MSSAFLWGAFQQDAFQIDAQTVTPCSFQDYVTDGYVDGGFVCGEVSPAASSGLIGGVRRRKRVVANINGQDLQFDSVQDVYAYLAKFSDKQRIEKAATKAYNKVKTVKRLGKAAPTITVKDIPDYLQDVSQEVARINEQIKQIWLDSLLKIANQRIEEDDEEAIFALLWN